MNVLERLRWIGGRQSSAAAIVITLISRVGTLFINLATGIVIARTLGPDGRGASSAMLLWAYVFAGLVTFGIPVAIRFNIRKQADDPGAILSTSIVLGVVFATAGAVLGSVLLPVLLHHYPNDVIHAAQILMCLTPAMALGPILQAYLEAKGRFAHSNSLAYLPSLGTLVVLIALYFAHAITPFAVALAYELPFTVTSAVTLFQLRRQLHVPSSFFTRSQALLHYGLRAYGLDVLNTLSTQIGQVVVVGLLSAASFGLYSVALNVSRVLHVLAVSLNSVLFPKATELDADEAVALVNRSARVIFAVNFLAGSFFAAVAPILIRIAFGAQYAPVSHVAQILIGEVVVAATASTLTQAFMATGRPGIVTLFQGIGLATTFPMMLVLVPRYGLAGAAVALVCSTFVRMGLVLGAYPIVLKRPIPGLILTRRDVQDVIVRLRRRVA